MSNLKFVENQFGDQYIYDINRDIFDSESVKSVLEKEYRADDLKNDSLYLYVGSDSGNLIRYFLDKSIPAGCTIVFFESAEIKKAIVDKGDINVGGKRIFVIEYIEFERSFGDINFFEYLSIDSIKIKKSLSAEYGFYQEYSEIYWKLESTIQKYRWENATGYGYEPFVERQLLNCADNYNPISNLKNCLSGSTVVVLGGGPSLDEHISWIRNNRKFFFVFAVARISARLIELDFEPDFVFSVDPTDKSYQLSKEMLLFSDKVTLISQYHVATKLLSQWPHRKYSTGNLLPWQSDLNPRNQDYFGGAGPTVTNHAVATANWMGAGKILLVGVEFCFTVEGYTHALGSSERKAGPLIESSGLTAETYDGRIAETRPDFYNAALSLDMMAKGINESGVEVINLSSGALKLKNIPYIQSKNIKLHERKKLSLDDSSLAEPEWLERLKNELVENLGSLEIIREKIEYAIDVHNKMYDGDFVSEKLKLDLESLESEIGSEFSDLLKIAKRISIRRLLRMAYKVSDLNELGSEEVRNRLNNYYESILFGVNQLSLFISNAIEITDTRILENKAVSNDRIEIDRILDDWISRNEFGRFRVFSHKSKFYKNSERIRELYLNEMERSYVDEQAAVDKIKNYYAFPRRLKKLCQTRDEKGLLLLRGSISGIDEFETFKIFIDAVILEYHGEFCEALNKYSMIVKNCDSPVIELTLKHIIEITSKNGNFQSALDAMAGLAIINKKYLFYYARALASNGQVREAIDHALEYTRIFGSENKVISKLSEWYEKLGLDVSDELELLLL